MDVVEKYGSLDMGLEFYTEVQDLNYLVEGLEDSPVLARYHRLNKAVAEVATDYSLVSYIPVSVENHSTLMDVIKVNHQYFVHLFTCLEDILHIF